MNNIKWSPNIDETYQVIFNTVVKYNKPKKLGKITLLDTTLREGEQTPKVEFTKEDKIKIADMLNDFGVNMIELSPLISKEHIQVIKTLATRGYKSDIIAHIRALKEDIDLALQCDTKWIAMFISTSDIQLKSKLKLTRQQALEKAVEAIEYAKSHGFKIRMTAEDASRTDPDFLIQFCKAIEEAKVDRIGVPDTVGVLTPQGMKSMISAVKKHVKTPLEIHCHNDLGLALANTLAGIEAGAETPHLTVNGLGERAGITPLAEFVVALKVCYNIQLPVKMELLTPLSKLVAKASKQPIPIHAPIVGENAFKHKGGTHIAAIVKNPAAYEIIPPETIGQSRKVIFGKYSGKNAVKLLFSLLGLPNSDREIQLTLSRIKEQGEFKDLEIDLKDPPAIFNKRFLAKPEHEDIFNNNH
ncbi:MAG: 2-isopropylmalate synthase [Candidatus Odinarchaeum yellowstonii]|uniref:2-isopropylmalate synthase n=1 Tax=Odinarchaeota yellowstonii (strain LCB_4) TaxID=1841599 RepID=A0AAF0D1E5_ODILC|nr:MAG: 2-isopropylmalate synthase [Candidatus Odinarchaeum yellowstonii]